MTKRLGVGDIDELPLGERGQSPLLLGNVLLALGLALVAPLFVCREEAAEGDDRAARGELDIRNGRPGEGRAKSQGRGRTASCCPFAYR